MLLGFIIIFDVNIATNNEWEVFRVPIMTLIYIARNIHFAVKTPLAYGFIKTSNIKSLKYNYQKQRKEKRHLS